MRERLRQEYGLQSLIWVGDRELLTGARIKEELQNIEGFGWISTLRAPQLKKLAQEGTLDITKFNEQTDLYEFESSLYPGERLVACRNPMLALERARKREELLAGTEKELQKLVTATQREKRKLQGQDKIGVRVGRILSRSKMGKHFEWDIKEDRFEYKRLEDKIKEEVGSTIVAFFLLSLYTPKQIKSGTAANVP